MLTGKGRGWRTWLFIVPVILGILLFTAPLSASAGENGEHPSGAVSAGSANEGAETLSTESTDHGVAEPSIEEAESKAEAEEIGLGTILPLWSVLPFLGILFSIALFPLFAPTFWHHHYPKVSAFWALLFAIPFLLAYKGEAFNEIMEIYLIDYIPFIVLLWGLFAASGGILLSGSLVGTPAVNLLMLVIGTILASWMGTTGASMVLIRPILRANKDRKNKMHIVIFFIFLVSNIGGSLTPLGDPPLFLGFLHGVPFFWTLNLLPHMGFAAGVLLAVFYILDSLLYRKEKDRLEKFHSGEKTPLRLQGMHNLLFLGGILAAVLFSGLVKLGKVNVLGVHMGLEGIVRDLFILLMIYLSMKTTRKQIRDDNHFTWFPIKEVAYLFAGIFMTIIPALAMLRAGSHGNLAFIVDVVKSPIHYFFITGALSSFLDNAPTYLTFFNLSLGNLGFPESLVTEVLKTGVAAGVTAETGRAFYYDLEAISVGAVFFGAMTYIGNAPNFMVRSIAEENNIKMPSFFGYMLWSLGILGILFVVTSLIFFT